MSETVCNVRQGCSKRWRALQTEPESDPAEERLLRLVKRPCLALLGAGRHEAAADVRAIETPRVCAPFGGCVRSSRLSTALAYSSPTWRAPCMPKCMLLESASSLTTPSTHASGGATAFICIWMFELRWSCMVSDMCPLMFVSRSERLGGCSMLPFPFVSTLTLERTCSCPSSWTTSVLLAPLRWLPLQQLCCETLTAAGKASSASGLTGCKPTGCAM